MTKWRIPAVAWVLLTGVVSADPGADFFETKVRPVLVEHCYPCHSAQAGKQRGGLRLDTRDGLLKGGDSGPALVPGKPSASLLVKAIRHVDDLKMPPKSKLPDAAVADLVDWIRRGAPDPRVTTASAGRTPWSFLPLRRPAVPPMRDAAWCRNDIDRFVLARLERDGLTPATPADKYALLRRLSFDLLGLPPAPDEVDAFVKDDSPDAYERLVDRLLASPRYGERWGRHWLDVVRYADSAGYEIDNYYDHAWVYRDYVVRSFNEDKPFDRFAQEQVAGDELRPESQEARVATGFATVGPYAFEGGIARPKVVEYQRLTDLADTFGSAFLGLTVGCARCHDHKFDPISQEDYFGLQAVFAASKAVTLPLDKNPQGPKAQVLGHHDKAPATRLLRRGELDAPGPEVAPALPRSLPGGGLVAENTPDAFKKRRATLARWLTAPENPLTARVFVNRVWQGHFGRGLVRTPDDFGTQGEAPTHPELLDYLASELAAHGWGVKHLHRLIVLSATYRMAGRAGGDSSRKDADARLLSRFPRRRLEAEALWDNLHATAGTINARAFGPAVYPPVAKEVIDAKLNMTWDADRDRGQWTRRGVYLVARRSLTLPFFESFNVTSPVASCACRDATVVAPQALELLNGPVAVEQARAFAARLRRECGDDSGAVVARAWLLAFGRPPTAEEKVRAVAFLREAPPVEFCLGLMNANEFLYVD